MPETASLQHPKPAPPTHPGAARRLGLNLSGFVALGLAWWLSTSFGGVPAFVLPPPADVGASLADGLLGGTLYPHIGFTAAATLSGVALGALAGFLLALLVAESPPIERALYPVVAGIQSVPKIALAPLIIVYLGFGFASKVFTVALLAFFPVFVNTVAGLRGVDPDLIDLYRSFTASRLHTLRHVKVPLALPTTVAALQIAFVLGIIGCITSELVASTQGLGFVIKSRAGELDISMMFAAVVVLALFGATGTALLRRLEARVLRWQRRAAR